jgi:chemotaxis protein MotA
MDLAPTIGIGGGFAVVVTANVMEGGNPMSLLLMPPLLLVFGTTILICIAGGTMMDAKNIPNSLKRAFTGKVEPAADMIPEVVSLAERARREGLLALEESIATIDDPFLVKGVTMAIDGTDPEEVRDIMEAEVFAKRLEDKQAAKFFGDAGAYAPTIGIIGTVMGLVHVLENLDKPESLGHSIAAAFVATLWGVLSANLIFLPAAARLDRLSGIEADEMELVVDGVLAIQSGSNPRLVAQKLRSLLPPDAAKAAEAAAATKKAA